MKRLSAGVGALVVGALLAVTVIPNASAASPRASLHAFACTRALDPPGRSVAVTAVMRPLAGTRHLALKFDLLSRRSGSGVQKVVRAGDLGVWITPTNPTLGQLPGDVWNLQKSVVELAAPATYRFRVTFRWTGAHRHLLGTAVRFSQACRQRELRPDLLVRSITVSSVPNHPNKNLYTAVIGNQGNSAAGPFDVLFAPMSGAGSPITHVIGRLGAHRNKTERFVGPVCTSATDPTITADSASQVDDLNRVNNALTATCPASSGT
jgi:hypothetical protein